MQNFNFSFFLVCVLFVFLFKKFGPFCLRKTFGQIFWGAGPGHTRFVNKNHFIINTKSYNLDFNIFSAQYVNPSYDSYDTSVPILKGSLQMYQSSSTRKSFGGRFNKAALYHYIHLNTLDNGLGGVRLESWLRLATGHQTCKKAQTMQTRFIKFCQGSGNFLD